MIKENAWAKLNLNLHLLTPKTAAGFYPVKFLNCQLSLADELSFKENDQKIIIDCTGFGVPQGRNNLVYRAADLLRKRIKKPKLGVRITLNKNIPIKAGLGGGSSDAAATIKGLTKLWQINLTKKDNQFLAENLGKDVFYLLIGGLCEVGQDGRQITPVKDKLPVFDLLIITPKDKKSSTTRMYQKINPLTIGKNTAKYTQLLQAIYENNKSAILANLFNDFETLAMSSYPVVYNIKEDLEKTGVQQTLLAGSGLSVVGFYETKKQAFAAKEKLTKIYPQIIYAQTK